jgi:hypothetical protein
MRKCNKGLEEIEKSVVVTKEVTVNVEQTILVIKIIEIIN